MEQAALMASDERARRIREDELDIYRGAMEVHQSTARWHDAAGHPDLAEAELARAARLRMQLEAIERELAGDPSPEE